VQGATGPKLAASSVWELGHSVGGASLTDYRRRGVTACAVLKVVMRVRATYRGTPRGVPLEERPQ